MSAYEMSGKKIPMGDKVGYGIGNLSYGIIFQVIGTYIVFYSTAVIGISGSLVGAVVSISVLWDAMSDPLMGYFSDITRSKWFGRRHLYILIGSLTMPIFNFLLWTIRPEWPSIIKFISMLINLLLVKTCITVFTTPYTALGAELSSDYNERTSIQGIKTIFFLIGLMFATVMGFLVFFNPTPAYPIGQLNPEAYKNMGITTSLISLVFGLVCFFTTKKYIPYISKYMKEDTQVKKSLKNLFSSFKLALKNENYKYVVYAYLFTNIASALISLLGIHVFTYTFKLDNMDIGIIFGVLFCISILSQPIWVKISMKIDKKPAVLLGLAISIIGSFIFLILVLMKDLIAGNFLHIIPFSVVTGFGTGALFSLPFSMIADTIDVDELTTGIRLEGVYYGSLTLFYKFSQSIAIFLVGILLDVIKFDSQAPIQPESTLIILGLTIAIGGIISFILATKSYCKYGLNKNKISTIQNQIKE